MTALAIVGTCVGGLLAYGFAWAYVFLRLRWHFKQHWDDRYYYSSDSGSEAAFFAACFLPIGLGLLAVYTFTATDRHGLPPARVRKAEYEAQLVDIERQQLAEIDRIQREIDDIKRKDAR